MIFRNLVIVVRLARNQISCFKYWPPVKSFPSSVCRTDKTHLSHWVASSEWCQQSVQLSSVQFSSVAQSCPTLCNPMDCSNSRLPCPPLSPEAYSNSCPLRRWCHPTISSSAIPFSSCLQSFPASGLSQWVSSSNEHQVAKILELQLQHQSFQWIFRIDLL